MPELPDDFHLPRYAVVPDVGLYLDQVVRWLNRSLQPLSLPEVTPSMVSNYVKKGYVTAPVRKQYSSEQLGRLLLLAIGKNVLMMDDLARLLKQWDQDPRPFSLRYDLYCEDLEQALSAAFSGEQLPKESAAGRLLRSLNIAVSHIILLNLSLSKGPQAHDIIPV